MENEYEINLVGKILAYRGSTRICFNIKELIALKDQIDRKETYTHWLLDCMIKAIIDEV